MWGLWLGCHVANVFKLAGWANRCRLSDRRRLRFAEQLCISPGSECNTLVCAQQQHRYVLHLCNMTWLRLQLEPRIMNYCHTKLKTRGKEFSSVQPPLFSYSMMSFVITGHEVFIRSLLTRCVILLFLNPLSVRYQSSRIEMTGLTSILMRTKGLVPALKW